MKIKKHLFKLNYFYLFSTVLVQVNSFSANYNLRNLKINIVSDNTWQAAQNLYNSDLTLLGPMIKKRRPVIALTISTLDEHKFDTKKLAKSKSKYYEGRKKWVEDNKGKPINFFEYKVLNWKHVGEVHSIGHKYELLGETFEERTYFFNCKKKVLNYTTLLTKNHIKDYSPKALEIMASTKCL